jgi:cellulose synthase/poly-beta-1,6-N-acetylglucosamine synthase-like glycosyltransferase
MSLRLESEIDFGSRDLESDDRFSSVTQPEPPVPFYLSADSAPAGYAVRRPAWVPAVCLGMFLVASVLTLPLLGTLTPWYARFLDSAFVGSQRLLEGGGSLSFRPFVALLILCLSLFAAGTGRERCLLLLFSWTLYGTSLLAVDLVMTGVDAAWMPRPFSPAGGIVAGLVGLTVFMVAVFNCYELPSGVVVRTRLRRHRMKMQLLIISLVVLLGVAVFSFFRERYLSGLKLWLLGGLDSELVLFVLGMICLLLVLSARERRKKPASGPDLSVAFLIPAHNEAHRIGKSIQALDAAAEHYQRPCHLYVVDNASTDGTRAVAEQSLRQCNTLSGTVLECPTPGKSHALNWGLAKISEEIIVRIDADTVVIPSILTTIMPWFWDPTVGGVSGLALARADTPRWLFALRTIEVYYGVAFLRLAQSAADAIMVMPGVVASYRGSLVRELGGFGVGFNGEDADITMRIGRLGYRIVVDPGVEVYTEVPQTLSHLREQRQRWARGLFHMGSRNISCIRMGQGIRGLLMLPWAIVNASRRSVMIPLLLCALVVELLDPSVFSLREVSVVAGFVVGLQIVVICLLLAAYRQFGAIRFVPAYLLFRLFRAYIAFETVLTLRLRPWRKASGALHRAPKPRLSMGGLWYSYNK